MSDDENDNRKTVADILAEYRSDADAMDRGWLYPPTTEYVRRLLDRIEAAWKRQEQCYLDQIRDAVNMIGHERFVKEHPPIGNAAAMREALTEIRDTIMNGGFDGRSPAHFVNICDEAISAPARNCDMFDDAETAHQSWLDDSDNWDEFGSPKLELHEWLFAPAKKKGEGK